MNSTPTPTPQGTPGDNGPECEKCGASVHLRDNTEHSGYCDNCAHVLVDELSTQLSTAQARASAAETALARAEEKLSNVRQENELRKAGHARLIPLLTDGDCRAPHEQVAEIKSALATTQAELTIAQNTLANAQDDITRARKLAGVNMDEFSGATSAVLATQAELSAAQRRAQLYLNTLNALANNGVLSESLIEHYVHEEDAKLRWAGEG